MGVISFQKIFNLFGLKGHLVEKMWDVTIVTTDARTHAWKCEDRARIREAGFAILKYQNVKNAWETILSVETTV